MDNKDREWLLREMIDGHLPKSSVDDIIRRGFLTAPASTKYHGDYEGGLFDHSFKVAQSLLTLTGGMKLRWKNTRSPRLIGLFHDLCKIDQYEIDPETGKYRYRGDTLLKGHGDKSVQFLSQYTSLTEEEILCIRYHMGAFTDSVEWSDYTRAVHAYPNVLWTHTADMMAAHIERV